MQWQICTRKSKDEFCCTLKANKTTKQKNIIDFSFIDKHLECVTH